jgi:hypothetical protein
MLGEEFKATDEEQEELLREAPILLQGESNLPDSFL